jgi:hypothetical protein
MSSSSDFDRVVVKNSPAFSDYGSFLELLEAIKLLSSKHLPQTVCKLCTNDLIPEARITRLQYTPAVLVYSHVLHSCSVR